jgi:hypothetical protein
MTPTHRLDVTQVEAVPRDPAVCRELVRQAHAHRSSAAAIGEMDGEGAFQLAYDGCRKIALAVVLAGGARPRSAAHHEVTFDAAAALVAAHRSGADRTALRRSLDDATDLRRVRGGAEYRGETVHASTLAEAMEILDELLAGLPALAEDLLA